MSRIEMVLVGIKKKWVAIRTDEFERGRFLRQLELNIVRAVWIGVLILICITARKCGPKIEPNRIGRSAELFNLKAGKHGLTNGLNGPGEARADGTGGLAKPGGDFAKPPGLSFGGGSW